MLKELFYSFCPVVLASHVALQRGFLEEEFAKDDVDIRHITTLPSRDWQSHFSHKYPHLIRDGGNVPPIWTRSEGADIRVIGMIWVRRAQVVLVKKDSAITSVKELKGKRLPLVRRLGSLIDFPRAITKRGIIMSLKAHGLGEDDVHFVDIPLSTSIISNEKAVTTTGGRKVPPPSIRVDEPGKQLLKRPEVDALNRGEVDAIFAFGGAEVMLEQAGIGRVLYNLNDHPDWKYRVNHYPYVCTVTGELARDYPELLVRWMRALIRAGIWAKDNSDEVVDIMARERMVPLEAFKRSYPEDFHQHLVPEITDMGIEALEIEKRFLREHGFINNDFDVRSWVDGSFLEQAMQELRAEEIMATVDK